MSELIAAKRGSCSHQSFTDEELDVSRVFFVGSYGDVHSQNARVKDTNITLRHGEGREQSAWLNDAESRVSLV